ncbi:hypothetical protein AKG94_20995 [Vibrio harveyi]|uniref:hypothetical protein n=1 Tax=Vibrio harveyi TaxID=669 RepID=UPI0002EF0C38|nr:hypothetical protein [Vibrio harveyi]KNY40709.1 hypothetical protein AKG94_20995 [Vibrio harveyi]
MNQYRSLVSKLIETIENTDALGELKQELIENLKAAKDILNPIDYDALKRITIRALVYECGSAEDLSELESLINDVPTDVLSAEDFSQITELAACNRWM